jgi:hypothetical protein
MASSGLVMPHTLIRVRTAITSFAVLQLVWESIKRSAAGSLVQFPNPAEPGISAFTKFFLLKSKKSISKALKVF